MPPILPMLPFILQGAGAVAGGIGAWKQAEIEEQMGRENLRLRKEELALSKKYGDRDRNMAALSFLAQQRDRAMNTALSGVWSQALGL